MLLATLALAQRFRRVNAGFIYRHYDPPTTTLRTIHLTAHDGGVWFDWAHTSINHAYYHKQWTRLMADRPHWWQRFDSPGGYSADGTTLGFYFRAQRSAGYNLVHRPFLLFRLPYWFLAAASTVAPAAALRRRLRTRRRTRRGLCPRCGYDLRESPNRCPECGTAVANAA